jgi:hypothetical protein
MNFVKKTLLIIFLSLFYTGQVSSSKLPLDNLFWNIKDAKIIDELFIVASFEDGEETSFLIRSKAAYDVSGDLVVLDDLIILEYTFATSDDRNLDSSGNAMAITLVSNDDYNPLDGCTVNSGISTCSNIRGSTVENSCLSMMELG